LTDNNNLSVDVSRIGAQVISGIGFLGAGTIIVNSHQEVKGLTTAVGLWASGCMGIALGAGFYECAIIGALLIFISTKFLDRLGVYIAQNAPNFNIYIEFKDVADINEIIHFLKTRNLIIYSTELNNTTPENGLISSAVIYLHLDKSEDRIDLISHLASMECVVIVNEI